MVTYGQHEPQRLETRTRRYEDGTAYVSNDHKLTDPRVFCYTYNLHVKLENNVPFVQLHVSVFL